MRILFIGDLIGKPGRIALHQAMPELRERARPDFIIANGENSAGGRGITERTAADIFAAGVDVITTGNHAFRHRDAYEFLDRAERVVRPANYMTSSPGKGWVIVNRDGMRIGVINLAGMVQMQVARSPFIEIETILERIGDRTDAIIVDFHAEITSEKVGMGWHLDGRVSGVFGTHTHVPTADARVLPGGTALICDVGMSGATNSILGARVEQVLAGFRTQMPGRLEVADGEVTISSVVVEIGADGLAKSIEQILLPVTR